MEVKHNPDLTSSELAVLWTTYQTDTMLRCMLRHFMEVCADEQIKQLQQAALGTAESAIRSAEAIFTRENIPLPVGLTDEDCHPSAKQLYPDVFTLGYLKHMARLGMAAASVSLSVCVRKDMRDLFTIALSKASYLYNKICDLMLEKGVLVRPPLIAKPEKAEFVKDESFFSSLFGEHRPLNAIELAHMGMNTETNLIGFALLMGFAQTARSKEIREYAWKGKEIAKRHISLIAKTMLNDNITQSSSWIADVTESQDPPFSDKLMCFQITAICSAGFSNYAASAASSQRTDLGVMYARMMAETSEYSLDGNRLMIKYGWLEQPPQNKDREALTRQ